MAVSVIASFLEGRTFHVSLEGEQSPLKTISAGVPQGSCLSPVLYAIYIDDISNLGPCEEGTLLGLVADDSAFFASPVNATHAA